MPTMISARTFFRPNDLADEVLARLETGVIGRRAAALELAELLEDSMPSVRLQTASADELRDAAGAFQLGGEA